MSFTSAAVLLFLSAAAAAENAEPLASARAVREEAAREFWGIAATKNITGPPPPPPKRQEECETEEYRVLVECEDDAIRLGCEHRHVNEEFECLEVNLEKLSNDCRVCGALFCGGPFLPNPPFSPLFDRRRLSTLSLARFSRCGCTSTPSA